MTNNITNFITSPEILAECPIAPLFEQEYYILFI
jgi:hypothetical protein